MGILGKGKLLAEEFGELMNRKVRLASHIVESIPNHFIILRQLRDIRERLDDISKEMGEFQLKEVLMSRLPQTGNREGRETGAHIVESEVCGRKEDVEKEKLIHQWIAGGLAQRSAHDRVSKPEDIGSDYLNDLLRMSFLEVVSGCGDSSTTRIKMHDLAISVAGNEFLAAGKTEQQGTLEQSHSLPKVCDFFTTTRHAVVDCNSSSGLIHKALYRAKGLRFIGRLRNLQSMPIFIAGKTWEEGILQLLELQNLPGELKIKHLENVERRHVARTCLISEDLPGNRRDYCLENMQLNSLGLSWGDADEHKLSVSMRGPRSQTGHHSVETARILLDSTLKPNSRIKKLFVNGYPGTEFPNWMNAAALCNLIQLELANCTNSESLPTLGELPLLKVLRIQGMDSVVNIGNEFFGGMRAFSSLTEFSLKDFPKLETWSTNPVEAFTCLNKLTIINCPVLITMPWISSTCRDQKLPPSDATELHSLPHGLTNLTSLESLEIIECPNLVSLPEQSLEGLSSLRSLSIENCHSLTSLPSRMQHATALERLTIMYCSNLVSLPIGLQHLSALKSLSILSCTGLASLPEELQFITTLQNLEFHDCPEVMELPAWVENLVSLRSLTISDCQNICPELEKRCQRGNGVDWQKISHTPYIYVGSSTLQQRRDTC
ncbi:hypothetical protein H0E87_020155 [Populus deltoides]|uniref:Uncharacterized protein n=1 Tax=Populus deltoides TaxID=3696 RepID=A0A8T2XMR8_POPDE|nr:hypothetical protein H0E87_020155 [Populus deltoides]